MSKKTKIQFNNTKSVVDRNSGRKAINMLFEPENKKKSQSKVNSTPKRTMKSDVDSLFIVGVTERSAQEASPIGACFGAGSLYLDNLNGQHLNLDEFVEYRGSIPISKDGSRIKKDEERDVVVTSLSERAKAAYSSSSSIPASYQTWRHAYQIIDKRKPQYKQIWTNSDSSNIKKKTRRKKNTEL